MTRRPLRTPLNQPIDPREAQAPTPIQRPARVTLNEPTVLSAAAPTPIIPTKRKAAYVPPSRRDRTQVAFFVDPVTKRQLETIAFNERRRLSSLMLEATDMLFQSRSMTRTAVQGSTSEDGVE